MHVQNTQSHIFLSRLPVVRLTSHFSAILIFWARREHISGPLTFQFHQEVNFLECRCRMRSIPITPQVQKGSEDYKAEQIDLIHHLRHERLSQEPTVWWLKDSCLWSGNTSIALSPEMFSVMIYIRCALLSGRQCQCLVWNVLWHPSMNSSMNVLYWRWFTPPFDMNRSV